MEKLEADYDYCRKCFMDGESDEKAYEVFSDAISAAFDAFVLYADHNMFHAMFSLSRYSLCDESYAAIKMLYPPCRNGGLSELSNPKCRKSIMYNFLCLKSREYIQGFSKEQIELLRMAREVEA